MTNLSKLKDLVLKTMTFKIILILSDIFSMPSPMTGEEWLLLGKNTKELRKKYMFYGR